MDDPIIIEVGYQSLNTNTKLKNKINSVLFFLKIVL
jgi:hypothetical protein